MNSKVTSINNYFVVSSSDIAQDLKDLFLVDSSGNYLFFNQLHRHNVSRYLQRDIQIGDNFFSLLNSDGKKSFAQLISNCLQKSKIQLPVEISWGKTKLYVESCTPGNSTSGTQAILFVASAICPDSQIDWDKALVDFRQQILGQDNLAELAKLTASFCYTWFKYDAFNFDVVDEDISQIFGIYAEDTPLGHKRPIPVTTHDMPLSSQRHEKLIAGKSYLLFPEENVSREGVVPFGATDRRSRTIMTVPIVWDGKTRAFFSLHSYTPERYDSNDLERAKAIGQTIAGAVFRAETRRKLLESRDRYRQLLEHLNDGVIVLNPRGKIDYVNRRFCVMLGYSAKELLGTSPLKFLTKESGKRYKTQYPVKETALHGTFELDWIKKSGELLPTRVSYQIFQGEDGSYQGSIGVVTDITEQIQIEKFRKEQMKFLAESRLAALNMMEDANEARLRAEEAEKELQKTNRSLEAANRRLQKTMLELEEARDQLAEALALARQADKLKSEFLANTSHELRTPLNAIIGFLNLILDGLCDSPEEEREYLENALKSSEHLLSLINDLLDIARIEAGKMELELGATDVQTIFDEVYLMTHVQAQNKGLYLRFNLPQAHNIKVWADPQKFKQILINLVGNSLKFTNFGGIEVTAGVLPVKKMAIIRVKDTGIGVAPEFQKRIFEKFTQADSSTSRRFGGAGLGLAITKNLVELMGGTISLTSPGRGKGTTISFTLPLAAEDGSGPLVESNEAEEKLADNSHNGNGE